MLVRVKENNLKSIEDFAGQCITDCQGVASILEQKATSPNEISEYKQWAISIGEAVAEAAAEGGILGMGSGSVSEKEGKLLISIKAALG